MSQYFDKDFFKFFMGFLSIISLSLVVIVATKLYQEREVIKSEKNTSPAVNVIE